MFLLFLSFKLFKRAVKQARDVWKWSFHRIYVGPYVHCLVRGYLWQVLNSVENSSKSLPVYRTGDLYYLPALPKSCPSTHWFYIKILAIHEKVPVCRTGWVSYLPAHIIFYLVSGGRTCSIFNTGAKAQPRGDCQMLHQRVTVQFSPRLLYEDGQNGIKRMGANTLSISHRFLKSFKAGPVY